ncbi:MAG: hypothetical protein ACE5OS_06715 [Anaerolineae bacterium]
MNQRPTTVPTIFDLVSISLFTSATLLLEQGLARIFSVTTYYHFAFLMISLALFGLSVSGTFIYLKQRWFPAQKARSQIATFSALFALAVIGTLSIVTRFSIRVHLESRDQIAFTSANVLETLVLCVVAAIPFVLMGMAVSLSVHHFRAQIHRVYFFDLAGTGLACVLFVPLANLLSGPAVVIVAAIVAACGALVMAARSGHKVTHTLSVAVAVIVLLAFSAEQVVRTFRVVTVKGKHEDDYDFSKWNSFSRVTVDEVGGIPLIVIDGMAATAIYPPDAPQSGWVLSSIGELVYNIRQPGHALVIGSGGGGDVQSALALGSPEVTAVEINPVIVNDVMLGEYKSLSGDLYERPDVRTVVAEGRNYIRRSDETFDSIQLTLVDTFAATASGAFALSENSLYTVEAFLDFLNHLNPDGLLSVTRWVTNPDRDFIRTASVAREALVRLGARNPEDHIVAIRDRPGMGTLLVRRSPFPAEELDRLDQLAAEHDWEIMHAPGRHTNSHVAELLLAANPSRFYESYSADVTPTTDNRPFFFYSVKPRDLIPSGGNWSRLLLNNFAVVVLFTVLVIVAALTVLFILGPLWLRRREKAHNAQTRGRRMLVYFMALGVGFITVEIALLQRFVLFLGHPSYSFATVVFSILAMSSLGARTSGRVSDAQRASMIRLAASTVIVIMCLHALLLNGLLARLVGLPLGARLLITFFLLAPSSYAMGFLLPLGVRTVDDIAPEMVPWCWGLNGSASVVGSVLTMVGMINLGFQATLIAGAAVYTVALLSARR